MQRRLTAHAAIDPDKGTMVVMQIGLQHGLAPKIDKPAPKTAS